MEMVTKMMIAYPIYSKSIFSKVMYLCSKKFPDMSSLMIKDALSSSQTVAFCCVSFTGVSDFLQELSGNQSPQKSHLILTALVLRGRLHNYSYYVK